MTPAVAVGPGGGRAGNTGTCAIVLNVPFAPTAATLSPNDGRVSVGLTDATHDIPSALGVSAMLASPVVQTGTPLTVPFGVNRNVPDPPRGTPLIVPGAGVPMLPP